jgi:membrane-bound ClpP family serine protease
MRKKHPILFGIIILFLIGTGFFLVVYGISAVSGEKRSFAIHDRVGIVSVEGFIGDSNDIVEQLNQFSKDDSIKAVIVRINSPGGSVAPSQEIYEAILQLKKKKKVVASMGSVAASGGYMIACAADKIVANPGTITGSISAIMTAMKLPQPEKAEVPARKIVDYLLSPSHRAGSCSRCRTSPTSCFPTSCAGRTRRASATTSRKWMSWRIA